MVVRIHNVGRWQQLPVGQILELRGEKRRKVRLEVNCPAPTRFDVVELGQGDSPSRSGLTFLAVVQGFEVIEFAVAGEAHVVATSEAEVWFFTDDGDNFASENTEAVSFTKIANRRVRNPELERYMYKMEQNMMRRLAHQTAEMEARIEARAQSAVEGHDPETGEVADEVSDGSTDGDQGEAGDATLVVAASAPKGKAKGGTASA